MSFDVNVAGSQPRQVALYIVDWDNRGRAETVVVADGSSGAPLDTRILPNSDTLTNSANFVNGTYLIWNISGHVTITVTPNGGPNGVVSGVFFGGGTTAIAATGGVQQSAVVGAAFTPLQARPASNS